MALETEANTNPINNFLKSPLGNNLALGAGMALVMGIMAAVWLWGQKPDYRILLSNFSDRDGGSIIAALQQMNVPYQFAEGGGAILVPADRVHDARLKLAAQGLPKAGNVGFELMENQKLGVSQFLEQVNFQRALEGELARSINSIAFIQSSRVHLAIPKPTVFVRDKQRPTASVLLNLHPGRSLDEHHVSAILHLVSSSIPELSPDNVTIVDQNGNLLSSKDNILNKKDRLDPTQLKYVQELQEGIIHRVESILTPMMGKGNVRAEATVDVDFSHSEQAAEIFKPNNTPENTAKRSEHSNESSNSESNNTGGVPGASSNQPGQQKQSESGNNSNNSQRENTVNYELDKTVRYIQNPTGSIKRITVAVLVNNKTELDADGKPVSKPLTDAEKEQINGLVKEAMGFNKDRGDSLNVTNTAFTFQPNEDIPEDPLWKQFATVDNIKSAFQYLVAGLIILFLYLNLLKPMIQRIAPPPPNETSQDAETAAEAGMQAAGMQEANQQQSSQSSTNPQEEINPQKNKLGMAKKMAMEDPRMVANILKEWVSE